MHDARVYRVSGLAEKLQASNLIILGDSAYPLTPNLLTAYPNPVTDAEHAFNSLLKRRRVSVENAFARLKGQWRRLKFIDADSDERVNLIIQSCIILHNAGIQANIPFESPEPANDVADDTLGDSSEASASQHVTSRALRRAGGAVRDQMALSLI